MITIQNRVYREGMYDGAVYMLKDLMKNSSDLKPVSLLERIDYWASKMEEGKEIDCDAILNELEEVNENL